MFKTLIRDDEPPIDPVDKIGKASNIDGEFEMVRWRE